MVSQIEFKGPCSSSSITFEVINPPFQIIIQFALTTFGKCYYLLKTYLIRIESLFFITWFTNRNKTYSQILGQIVAPPRSKWKKRGVDEWLYFHRVDGLTLVGNGKGLIDGRGETWWEKVSYKHTLYFPEPFLVSFQISTTHRLSALCLTEWKGIGTHSKCFHLIFFSFLQHVYKLMFLVFLMKAMRFSHCNNLQVRGLRHINSQKNHVSINGCNDTVISDLVITAPRKSPNTDGIDVSSSTNLRIHDSVMATGTLLIPMNFTLFFLYYQAIFLSTLYSLISWIIFLLLVIKKGDDCIAINGGTSNVHISNITCGPGHGIRYLSLTKAINNQHAGNNHFHGFCSIGSLGKNGKHDEVETISISNCTFNRTDNGVRIKTWQVATQTIKQNLIEEFLEV